MRGGRTSAGWCGGLDPVNHQTRSFLEGAAVLARNSVLIVECGGHAGEFHAHRFLCCGCVSIFLLLVVVQTRRLLTGVTKAMPAASRQVKGATGSC